MWLSGLVLLGCRAWADQQAGGWLSTARAWDIQGSHLKGGGDHELRVGMCAFGIQRISSTISTCSTPGTSSTPGHLEVGSQVVDGQPDFPVEPLIQSAGIPPGQARAGEPCHVANCQTSRLGCGMQVDRGPGAPFWGGELSKTKSFFVSVTCYPLIILGSPRARPAPQAPAHLRGRLRIQ